MVKLKALRRFRQQQEQALVWINKGDVYHVPEDSVKFHEQTGRGKRLPAKPAKKGD